MKNLDVNARRVAAFIFFLLMKNLVRRLLAYTALKILDENVTKVTAFFFLRLMENLVWKLHILSRRPWMRMLAKLLQFFCAFIFFIFVSG